MSAVPYEDLTSRNLGFVDEAEQSRLRDAAVFVCGVGGMGGAAVQSLVRAGIGAVGIADFDVFETTNLNRQVFASTLTLGRAKTDVTAEALLRINPDLRISSYGAEWVDELDEILVTHDVVVNGMDDPRAALALYRAARRHGVTVVDSFVSPHPSVYVVRPEDPRPEEWLGFPTVGLPLDAVRDTHLQTALLLELAWVSSVSRGIGRMSEDIVAEILRGERPRCSFAPIVIIAGNLMAHEAMGAVLGRPSGAGHRGYFLDPRTGRVERPGPAPLMALRRWLSLFRLARLAGV